MYFLLDGDGYVMGSGEVATGHGRWLDAPQGFDWRWQGAYRYGEGEWVLDTEKLARMKEAEAVLEQRWEREVAGRALREALLMAWMADGLDDAELAHFEPAWPIWEAGERYLAGQVVAYGGGLYRVQQEVHALAHQPPDAAGMLAVYRAVVVDGVGTLEDPVPFVYGMDVGEGLYYGYEGAVYFAKSDMPACVWVPGSPGVWQWEAVGSDAQ